MNVFVLCAGRCGSTTFAKACVHITNYTSGHETRAHLLDRRLDYPENHIEVDNRLSWFLGSLGERYGDAVVWVHLTRDPEKVAVSYAKRFGVRAGIMPAFGSGILRRRPASERERLHVARLYVETVTANVEEFLAVRTNVIRVRIEEPHAGFDRLWELIGADGDRDAAHAEFRHRHNASKPQPVQRRSNGTTRVLRVSNGPARR